MRVASTLDTLLVLSRSLPIAKQGGILPDALDLLLAGVGCARGVVYRAAGGALELAGDRGLPRPLRSSIERLPLEGAPWFAAQRAALDRKIVVDRDPGASLRSPLDRAVMAFAQWGHVVACPIAERDLYGVMVLAWPEGEEPVCAAVAVVEIACGMIGARLARLAEEPRRAGPKAGGGHVVHASTVGILASAFAEDLDARLAEVEREAAGAGSSARALAATRRSAARFLAALHPAPPALLDLASLLDDVRALAAPNLERRRVDVTLAADGPHTVVGRQADLMQLFLQLLLGAAGALGDAGDAGDAPSDRAALVPRAFRLEVRRSARHEVVVLRDEEAGARSSFFDLAPQGSRDLAVLRRIAAAHEAYLEIEPDARAPDGGSEGIHFRLALPAVMSEAERRASLSAGPRALAGGARPVIVWIDGDELFLEIMVRSLPEIDVRVAGSGAEAMQLFTFGVVPALVLCNLHLPDVDGHDLHAEVERRSRALAARFVFVSEGSPPPAIASYLVVSGCPTLKRPIDVDQVRALALREVAGPVLPAAAAPEVDERAATLPAPPPQAAPPALPRPHRPGDSMPPRGAVPREQQLVSVARAAADVLRRDGPQSGAALGAMLRDLGLSQQEAFSVLSFALSKGILVRDAPHSTLLRAPDPASRSVLVVDDDADLRETLRDVLQDEGYRVETTANGREALDRLLARDPPRLLVLDLMMPVMDGWQVLEELARNAALSWIPVVIISAGKSRLEGVRAPRVHEFMSKPLDYHRLVSTIDRSMKTRAAVV